MEETITKEELKELQKIKGKVRGMAIEADIKFLIREKGKEAVEESEQSMKNIGYSVKYQEINPMKFYPIALKGITLLSIQRLFNFKDEKFVELGKFAFQLPSILRLFMRHLLSLDMLVKGIPIGWEKYYTAGSLKVIEYDAVKKYIIARLKGFRLVPVHCQIAKGYFSNIIQMIVGEQVNCEETKCVHRGDEYDEFLMK